MISLQFRQLTGIGCPLRIANIIRDQAPASPLRSVYHSNPYSNLPKATTKSRSLVSAVSAAAAVDTMSSCDPSSFSNPDVARVTHSDFEVDVDFATKSLRWWGKHTVRIQQEGAAELLLDAAALKVDSVSVNGSSVTLSEGKSSPALGSAVSIPLPAGLPVGSAVAVEMLWTTSPSAAAVQWLAPEQTAGGTHPFLFTQCQAIHARSLVPCQDTPGAKFTYTAAVRVAEPLVALMSALQEDDAAGDLAHLPPGRPGCKVFRFCQPLPISSYLLALAVGDLVSRDLSPISRVWSEPATVEAAANEFVDTPKFLDAAASLAGPYRWGRYDLLLLPPSFPYGGMENVCLTFVTPTLLAGDRSLANVVAHEIAHSWTGNLVSNARWSEFWLNEGPTVWLERRIGAVLEGEASFQFSASLGWITLKKSVANWGGDHPYTCLIPDLSAGVDPDDAFSSIPYEKGFAFWAYLERLVGGTDRFLPFFRSYVDHFAATPLTSEDFKAYFMGYFRERGVGAVEEVDWEAWLHRPGMPPVEMAYDETLAEAAFGLAAKWHTCDVMGLGSEGPPGAGPDDMAGWSSTQIVAFLDRLGELRSLTPAHPRTTRAMAKAYPTLESSRNAEIRCAWYLLCLKAGDASVVPAAEAFLGEQGRMKFVRPLFRAMHSSAKLPGGKEHALKTFKACRDRYHPICSKMVAADLKLEMSGGEEGVEAA